MEFCPTLNNTADTQPCSTNTEDHVCANDSVLRKHKETSDSSSVSCGDVCLTQAGVLSVAVMLAQWTEEVTDWLSFSSFLQYYSSDYVSSPHTLQ